jgi:hypothetical protein
MERQGYANYNFNSDWLGLTDAKGYNAALYLRFSKDDGLSLNSVQKKMQNTLFGIITKRDKL